MNDDEWKAWAQKMSTLLTMYGDAASDMEELEILSDAILSDHEDPGERNDGSGWTFHMGPWDIMGRIERHCEDFDPVEFDRYVKRRTKEGS